MARRCRSRDRCNGNKKGKKGTLDEKRTKSDEKLELTVGEKETKKRCNTYVHLYICVYMCVWPRCPLGQRHPAQSRGRLILLHIMQIPVHRSASSSPSLLLPARARFTLYLSRAASLLAVSRCAHSRSCTILHDADRSTKGFTADGVFSPANGRDRWNDFWNPLGC